MKSLACHLSAIVFCALLSFATVNHAQAPGAGAIKGVVYDQSSSAIKGANVELVSETTEVSRTISTDGSGSFTFPLLTPGPYSVTVEANGFSKSTAKAINVVGTETSVVDFHLAVANVGATVYVQPSIELAQTESSALGRAVDHRTVEALPLATRNYTQILSLSPGVVVELPDAKVLGRGTQNVAANGNKTTGNNIQFNGIDANNLSQNSAANDGEEVGVAAPAPDTILEFKVQTGNFDA